MAPPGGTGPLPRRPGRAPLPGRRPGQPAGRPQPGNRMEHRPGPARPRRSRARPAPAPAAERAAILALGDDLGLVWDAPTTTDRDRKQLLRTLIDEVNITARRDDPDPNARLVLRWKGGAIGEL